HEPNGDGELSPPTLRTRINLPPPLAACLTGATDPRVVAVLVRVQQLGNLQARRTPEAEWAGELMVAAFLRHRGVVAEQVAPELAGAMVTRPDQPPGRVGVVTRVPDDVSVLRLCRGELGVDKRVRQFGPAQTQPGHAGWAGRPQASFNLSASDSHPAPS